MTRNANTYHVGYDIFRRKDNSISHVAYFSFSMYLFLFQIYKQCNMEWVFGTHYDPMHSCIIVYIKILYRLSAVGIRIQC